MIITDQENRQLAERLVSLFQQNWRQRDYTETSRELKIFLAELRESNLAKMGCYGARQGSYVIRHSVHGGPIFIENGELQFLSLNLAKAVKTALDQEGIQILQVIE